MAVAALIGGQGLTQGSDHLIFPQFACFAREPNDLSRRSQRQGKLDRFVQSAANADVGAVAGKSDVVVSGGRSMSLTMSGPDIENGPGPQCTWSVSSWATMGTIFLTRSSASCTHGLSSRRRQTIIVSSPPGTSARRMLRRASPGR